MKKMVEMQTALEKLGFFCYKHNEKHYFRKPHTKGMRVVISDCVLKIQKTKVLYSFNDSIVERWETKFKSETAEEKPFTNKQKEIFLEQVITRMHDDGRSQVSITKFT